MGELLTIDETATRLRVTPATIRRWITDYGLPVHGVSKKSRYCDWDEVCDWVKLREAGRIRRDVRAAKAARSSVVIDLPRLR